MKIFTYKRFDILNYKKKLVVSLTAVIIASTAIGVLPVSAGPDEVIGQDGGFYNPPLAQEEIVEKVVKEATPAKKVAQVEIEYRVRPGDSLWSIADRTGISIAKLAQANNLSQEALIIVGQTLTIPGSAATYHRVAERENLSVIAAQYSVSVKELMLANNLADPDFIRVGMKLTVPGEIAEAAAPASVVQSGKIQIGGWAWPVAGEITSNFGIRGDRPHEGIDIGAGEGAVITAPEAGTVIWSAPRGTYGLTVILDHGNGIRSLYAHCSKLLVHEGQRIDKNHPIAKVGNTGNSQGPHLHMEILRQGVPLDPRLFLKERLFG